MGTTSTYGQHAGLFGFFAARSLLLDHHVVVLRVSPHAGAGPAAGGPDVIRRIFPTIVTITAERGAEPLPVEQTTVVAEAVVAGRAERAAQGRS